METCQIALPEAESSSILELTPWQIAFPDTEARCVLSEMSYKSKSSGKRWGLPIEKLVLVQRSGVQKAKKQDFSSTVEEQE